VRLQLVGGIRLGPSWSLLLNLPVLTAYTLATPAPRRRAPRIRFAAIRSPVAAGLKGYVTNLEGPTAEYVLGVYHQLWQIEKSFRNVPE
jgi:hypothetical protein